MLHVKSEGYSVIDLANPDLDSVPPPKGEEVPESSLSRRDTTPMSLDEILAALRDEQDRQAYISSQPPQSHPAQEVIVPPAPGVPDVE